MIWKLKLIMYKVHCFWHSGLSPTSPPQWQNVMQYIILNLLQYVNIVITNIYIDITISECNLYYRYMYHKILISICKKIQESNINIDIRYYKQYQFSHKNTCTNNNKSLKQTTFYFWWQVAEFLFEEQHEPWGVTNFFHNSPSGQQH